LDIDPDAWRFEFFYSIALTPAVAGIRGS